MHLVIGGAYQGKKEYVKRKYLIEESMIWQGGYSVAAGEWKCVCGLHNIVKELLLQKKAETDDSVTSCVRQMLDLNPDIILICDEVGGGIVPVEKAERDYRECVGRVLCELAKEADTVERVHCGIGQTIKYTVHVSLLRHGATRSNLMQRYLGVTDEPLCDEGIKALERGKRQGIYPPVQRVVASPLRRCVETASLLYPDLEPQLECGFRETDFGLFEGKNYEELMADEVCRDAYQAWIDSGGAMPFPEGESMQQSNVRVGEAFERLLSTLTGDTALIVHGGTIMGILSAYATPRREYYDYRCENGAGYLCRVELTGDKRLYRMRIIERIGVE